MIQVDNLSFSYDGAGYALQDISLSIDRRATAIIGRNGSGKTTFVKLLKGLLKPDSGSIKINGADISNQTPASLAKTVGLIFQNPNDQIFKSNVFDEVMFGPVNIKMSPDLARENSLKALKMVSLDDRLQVNPHDLSLHEKKLLCMASVMAMDTDVIIFDEPTIAQDNIGKEKIKSIIKELKARGKLVITIIHDMDFVAENFERTIVFQNGKVALDGETGEVFAQGDILRKADVEAPYITQLADKLGFSRVILNEEDFIRNYNNNISPR